MVVLSQMVVLEVVVGSLGELRTVCDLPPGRGSLQEGFQPPPEDYSCLDLEDSPSPGLSDPPSGNPLVPPLTSPQADTFLT